ncbi:MAG: HAD hydrolase-like protein [Xanthomonadales bacterium]|nr:HAD hydrolase-like protein [Xanthomonadales bacterium]
MNRIRDSSSLVFDCDGVILNSNAIKTQAFHQVALPFGVDHADSLVAHHLRNGGISRFEKFRYLADQIGVPQSDQIWVNRRCEEFARYVSEGLLSCEIADGLAELRTLFPSKRWFVVSGGKESELREVFRQRGIADLFEGGIHGSPADKHTILARLKAESGLLDGVFLGDSRFDHEAAIRANLDFVFVHGWTDLKDWKTYCLQNQIPAVESLGDLARLCNE